MDTGNLLRSTVDGKQVILVEEAEAERLLPQKLARAVLKKDKDLVTEAAGCQMPVRLISYSTIDGGGMMVGFCCEIQVSRGSKRVQRYSMVAVFRPLGFEREDLKAVVGKI